MKRKDFCQNWTSWTTLLLALSCGCFGGSRNQPELARVQGRVVFDGSPLPFARVTFEPTQGRPSYGTTDSDGRFELSYVGDRRGALLGPHQVRISTCDMKRDEVSGTETLMPERVPAAYNVNSILTAEVHEGTNQIEFDLKSAAR